VAVVTIMGRRRRKHNKSHAPNYTQRPQTLKVSTDDTHHAYGNDVIAAPGPAAAAATASLSVSNTHSQTNLPQPANSASTNISTRPQPETPVSSMRYLFRQDSDGVVDDTTSGPSVSSHSDSFHVCGLVLPWLFARRFTAAVVVLCFVVTLASTTLDPSELTMPAILTNIKDGISSFAHTVTTHDPRPGELLFEMGARPHHPVILVPGVVTTGLEVWQSKPCANYFRERIWGTMRMITTMLQNPDCWLEHLALNMSTGLDPDGIKLRPARGLEAGDYLMPGFWVWAKIIRNLADIGYDPNSLTMAPYDWRLAFQHLEKRDYYFTKLKSEIELLVTTNQGHKVVCVTHSFGGPVLAFFLKWVESPLGANAGPTWVDDHIEATMNVGAPWLGVPKAIASMISGEFRDTAEAGILTTVREKILSKLGLAQFLRSCRSMASMLPKGGDLIWGSPQNGAADDIATLVSTVSPQTDDIDDAEEKQQDMEDTNDYMYDRNDGHRQQQGVADQCDDGSSRRNSGADSTCTEAIGIDAADTDLLAVEDVESEPEEIEERGFALLLRDYVSSYMNLKFGTADASVNSGSNGSDKSEDELSTPSESAPIPTTSHAPEAKHTRKPNAVQALDCLTTRGCMISFDHGPRVTAQLRIIRDFFDQLDTNAPHHSEAQPSQPNDELKQLAEEAISNLTPFLCRKNVFGNGSHSVAPESEDCNCNDNACQCGDNKTVNFPDEESGAIPYIRTLSSLWVRNRQEEEAANVRIFEYICHAQNRADPETKLIALSALFRKLKAGLSFSDSMDLLRVISPTFMHNIDEHFSFGASEDPRERERTQDHSKYWSNPLESTLPNAPNMRLYCL
jgi:Lecithin:cholesterol acyltransferase